MRATTLISHIRWDISLIGASPNIYIYIYIYIKQKLFIRHFFLCIRLAWSYRVGHLVGPTTWSIGMDHLRPFSLLRHESHEILHQSESIGLLELVCFFFFNLKLLNLWATDQWGWYNYIDMRFRIYYGPKRIFRSPPIYSPKSLIHTIFTCGSPSKKSCNNFLPIYWILFFRTKYGDDLNY